MRSLLNSKYLGGVGILIILIISLLMHIRIMDHDFTGLHVWRQTQTQNTILGFAFEDGNILNPRKNERGAGDGIFRMEFPLMQWLLSIPLRLGFDSVRSVRLGMFIISLIAAAGFYKLTRLISGQRIWGLVGAWMLTFSPVYYYYSVNPMPDVMALTLSIWGIFMTFRDRHRGFTLVFAMGWLLLVLAGMVKLPFILLIAIPGFWILSEPSFRRGGRMPNPVILGIAALVSMPFFAWYLWVIPEWEGNGITRGILSMNADQAGKYFDYLWFHIRSTLPELLTGLPMFVLFMAGLVWHVRKINKGSGYCYAWCLSAALIGMLLLFELNMIEKVHDYYFLPLLPMILLVVWSGAVWLFERKELLIKILVVGLIILAPLNAFFRIDGRWDRTGFNEDLLIYKNELRNVVEDEALVVVGNDDSHHIFLYYINKKGWVFEKNWLDEDALRNMINQGARYLYSDARHVDEHPSLNKYFGTEVARFGSIRIYSLTLNNN